MKYKIIKDWKEQEEIIVWQDGELYHFTFVVTWPHELYEVKDPENYTILRSTWIKDKNWVDIHHMDKVRMQTYKKNGSKNWHNYWHVIYEGWRYMFEMNSFRCSLAVSSDFEVIGNMHIKDLFTTNTNEQITDATNT